MTFLTRIRTIIDSTQLFRHVGDILIYFLWNLISLELVLCSCHRTELARFRPYLSERYQCMKCDTVPNIVISTVVVNVVVVDIRVVVV